MNEIIVAIVGLISVAINAWVLIRLAGVKTELVANTSLTSGVVNDIGIVKEDIRKVEVATNSMKDALVKTTAEASKAEGEALGRLKQQVENNVQPSPDKQDPPGPGHEIDIEDVDKIKLEEEK